MANPAETDYAALRDDIAALKRQLADLAKHGRSAAASGARQAYEGLAERGETTLDTATEYVRGAPLTSIVVAFLVGCVAGRLVR